MVYKGSGKNASGRLADTGSDQKTAVPYYVAGILLIILGGYFAMRSKKGFLAVLVAAGTDILHVFIDYVLKEISGGRFAFSPGYPYDNKIAVDRKSVV